MANELVKEKQICEGEEEEEEEYNQKPLMYSLSGLDTLTPTLIVGDSLKMIGEYEETVGTCYLFSESDGPPKPVGDGTTPPKGNMDKQASGSKEAPARPKEVKHLASLQKMLKFRPIEEDHHQEHRAYQREDKESFETKFAA